MQTNLKWYYYSNSFCFGVFDWDYYNWLLQFLCYIYFNAFFSYIFYIIVNLHALTLHNWSNRNRQVMLNRDSKNYIHYKNSMRNRFCLTSKRYFLNLNLQRILYILLWTPSPLHNLHSSQIVKYAYTIVSSSHCGCVYGLNLIEVGLR